LIVVEKLNLASFAEHLNTKFRIRVDDSNVIEAELIVAEDVGSTPRQERFSLVFRGPLELFLPQQTYQIEHDKMGPLKLFLVPIGKEEDGFRYEAVFNRLHKVK
jgi:hypothetical protein